MYNVISSTSYKHAYRQYIRKGREGLGATDLKSLAEGADTGGGFFVPEDVLDTIIEKKPAPTRLMGRVAKYNTGRDALVIPKVNYTTDDIWTTGMRVTWTGEVPASATAARVNFPDSSNPANNGPGAVRIPVFTAMLSLDVSNDQIEDSMFPLLPWVSGKFKETIDLTHENMIVSGSGGNQPSGILINPGGTGQPAIVNMGNPLSGDGIFDLAYALPEQYDDSAVFVLNKTNTARTIQLLKDSNGRYLFGMGYQDSGISAGKPTDLAGYDYLYSAMMPNTVTGSSTPVANATPVIFGDLRGYYFVERIGFSIQVLNEVYAEYNKRVMVGRIRVGGQVVEDWRLKIGKQA